MSGTSRLAKDAVPDLTGALGSAWIVDAAAIAAKKVGGPPTELTVATWIARAPYAHPMWHSYLIACISLRAVEGWPPAKINMPGATHEIFVAALNPEHEPALDDFPQLLTPMNFVGQFIEPSDDAARARIRATVQDVIDGVLSPDTDFARHWIHRFSASNVLGDPKLMGQTRIVMDRGDGNAPVELVVPPQPGPQDLH